GGPTQLLVGPLQLRVARHARPHLRVVYEICEGVILAIDAELLRRRYAPGGHLGDEVILMTLTAAGGAGRSHVESPFSRDELQPFKLTAVADVLDGVELFMGDGIDQFHFGTETENTVEHGPEAIRR